MVIRAKFQASRADLANFPNSKSIPRTSFWYISVDTKPTYMRFSIRRAPVESHSLPHGYLENGEICFSLVL